MTEIKKRKLGGGKPSRTEAVGVRLDPKLKYLAELGARHQRRTLSSYIEWAIQDSLSRITLRLNSGDRTSIAEEASQLWDVDEADRFAKLAFGYPHLLTHEEQVRWKLIQECGYLWGADSRSGTYFWMTDEDHLKRNRLREKWADICAVARGDLPAEILPDWEKKDSKSKKPTEPDDMDDRPF